MNKTTKQIVIYGAIILFLAGIVWLAVTDKDNSISAYSLGMLTAQEQSFDFGVIQMEGGNVIHQFELKNESEDSVTIEKVFTSCMCTTAKVHDNNGDEHGIFGMHGVQQTNIKVGIGESVMIEAIFDPAAHGPAGVGLAQRSIYLETNSAASPKIELRFEAVVTR